MIEIVTHRDSWSGIYDVPLSVDVMTYLYIYNDVFVEEWNQYIMKNRADPDFIMSKLNIEEPPSGNNILYKNLSYEEKLKFAIMAKEFSESRQGKRGRNFQKLVEDFDAERNLIIPYASSFYTYVIVNKFADFISVYLIEELEIANIVNHLYLSIKKRNRVSTREQLFYSFEIDDEE